jgi:hypothetical protein
MESAMDGQASYYRFYDDGYALYISEMDAFTSYNIGFAWKCEGSHVTINLPNNTWQGYFVNENFINGKKESPPLTRITNEETLAKYGGEPFDFSPMPVFPRRDKTISGTGSKISIMNTNDSLVAAAVITPTGGRYLLLPPQRGETIDVPNGQYDVFFVYAAEPESLYQGDSFSIRQQHITITIQLVENGNYGIRKVK